MKKNKFNLAVRIWTILVYLFLFTPILVIIIMSFNGNKYGTLPIDFSFQWYVQLFSGNSDLLKATGLSLSFSILVAVTAMILGTVTAIGMQQMPGKWRERYRSVTSLPVVIPWLVQAIALLMIFNFIGLGRSYIGMFLGNTAIVVPYVIMMVLGRFGDADDNTENAARTLGAKPVRIFFDVTLYKLVPGIISGTLMSFIVCFNSFCIQYYLAPFGVRTLPLEIFTLVRSGYTPDMNALATIMVVATTTIVMILNKLGYSAKNIIG